MLVYLECKHRDGLVRLHSDDGQTLDVPFAKGGALPDLTAYKTGAFAEAPPPPPSAEDRLAALEAENAALKQALVDKGTLSLEDVESVKARG